VFELKKYKHKCGSMKIALDNFYLIKDHIFDHSTVRFRVTGATPFSSNFRSGVCLRRSLEQIKMQFIGGGTAFRGAGLRNWRQEGRRVSPNGDCKMRKMKGRVVELWDNS
jgi:hypothetical protein